MKTLEVAITMAFLVLKNVNFPQISAERRQKVKFSEMVLNYHPTKWEKAFQNLRFYTANYLSSNKKP